MRFWYSLNFKYLSECVNSCYASSYLHVFFGLWVASRMVVLCYLPYIYIYRTMSVSDALCFVVCSNAACCFTDGTLFGNGICILYKPRSLKYYISYNKCCFMRGQQAFPKHRTHIPSAHQRSLTVFFKHIGSKFFSVGLVGFICVFVLCFVSIWLPKNKSCVWGVSLCFLVLCLVYSIYLGHCVCGSVGVCGFELCFVLYLNMVFMLFMHNSSSTTVRVTSIFHVECSLKCRSRASFFVHFAHIICCSYAIYTWFQ